MFKSITTKYCAGAIAVAAILICAPKAQASLVGTVTVDLTPTFSLVNQVGFNPESAPFAVGGAGVNATGITLVGGAINSQIVGGIGQLFDSTVTVNNTGLVSRTVTFHFEETSTTLANLAAGIVLATSNFSGTNPNAPLVSLTAFKTTINGQTLANVGLGFDPGGVLGPIGIAGAQSNGIAKNVLVPVGAFSIAQDFTFTVAAGATFNFSNSAQVPTPAAVVAVPEPGSFLAGASVLGLIGGSQLLRRKRNRGVAC